MRKIPLRNRLGRIVKYAFVCNKDYASLIKMKWHCSNQKNTCYAEAYINGSNIKMHRLILDISDSKIQVDHKDHNGLNNQRKNLRSCNRMQNCSNRSCKKTATSKYLGVCWHKASKRWNSQITKNKKPFRIGYFKTEQEAAWAYDFVAMELHGEFANLNFSY